MKQHPVFPVVFTLAALLLSACGASTAPIPVTGSTSTPVVAADTTVIGLIERINGDEWIVNGQTLIVGDDVIPDEIFEVGDIVKAEGHLQPDGSLLVVRVEAASPDDLATATALANDNGNVNNNDNANDNDANNNGGDGNNNQNNNDNGNNNDNDNDDDDDDDNSGPGNDDDDDDDNSGPGNGDD